MQREVFPLMEKDLKSRLLDAMVSTVLDHWQELTDLDRAIGDGDHGINMKRGFEAVAADRERLIDSDLAAAATGLGRALVMTVGGASGPLFGTFFLELGKTLSDDPTRAELSDAFTRATAAVAARGKSGAGQKTLIDVLEPVAARLASAEPASPFDIARVAAEAADATIPLVATKGRASFLGERSVGHIDPGARSASLLVGAVCAVLEGDRS